MEHMSLENGYSYLVGSGGKGVQEGVFIGKGGGFFSQTVVERQVRDGF